MHVVHDEMNDFIDAEKEAHAVEERLLETAQELANRAGCTQEEALEALKRFAAEQEAAQALEREKAELFNMVDTLTDFRENGLPAGAIKRDRNADDPIAKRRAKAKAARKARRKNRA